MTPELPEGLQVALRVIDVLEQLEPERRIFVKTPEDIVLRKLLWFRHGGEVSDRQWADVQSVLRTQADRLDYDYLRDWASRL